MSPAKVAESRPWGAYVHFPWCLKKCPYCDFLSLPVEPQRLLRLRAGAGAKETSRTSAAELRQVGADSDDAADSYGAAAAAPPVTAEVARALLPHASYADAVLAELAARTAALQPTSAARSIFFGGGTPSLWQPEELGRVIRALWPTSSGEATVEREATVECNPTSLDEAHARRLLAVGVNRISLGVQSLNEERLEFLGRLHDPKGAFEAIGAAQRAGTPRVSADVIFGVTGQLPEQAAAEALRVAETGVTHLSAYALTIEPNTQFGTLAQRGKLPLLDEGLVAESFTAVASALEGAGFEHYEVSNYARSGHQSLHNLGYWRGDDYLGLGVGAWGTVQLPGGERLRYRNTASVEAYLKLWTETPPADPFAPGPHLSQHEPIDPATALREKVLLGLRLAEGIDLEGAAEKLGVTAWPAARARARDKLLEQGRLEWTGPRLRIPKRHWLFADGIIAELL